MKSKIHSTIVISSILAFVFISVAGILPTSQFENVLAQGEGGGAGQQGANQTMEDPNNLLTELWKGQFNLRMRLENMLLKLALKKLREQNLIGIIGDK